MSDKLLTSNAVKEAEKAGLQLQLPPLLEGQHQPHGGQPEPLQPEPEQPQKLSALHPSPPQPSYGFSAGHSSWGPR